MDASILVKSLEISTADFTILKWMERTQIQATVHNGVLKSLTQTVFQGVGCRSLVHRSWGFSSTTDTKNAPQTVKTADRLASLHNHQESIEIAEADPVTGEWSPDITPVTMDTIDVLFELIQDAHKKIKSIPYVVSSSVSILCITDKKIVLTSEGTYINQKEPRILCTISVIAKKSGKISQGREIIGGEKGLKSFKKGYFSNITENVAHKTIRRIDATLPPAGTVPVLLSGEVVGLLIHEVVGHAAEADIVRTGSFLSGKMGTKIASPAVSIYDDATYPGGFGTAGFDDEGVPAHVTPIITNGILTHYLHSRETAHWFNTESTGNARAWLFSREPVVRMSNTYVTPHDMSFEELLHTVKTGLYLTGVRGGSADRNGQFQFTTTDAEKIRNGELTGEYCVGPVIAGDALTALNVCTGVGDPETFVMHSSVCSKGESAFVGSGGPALATELHVGGLL
ncbi:MAG: TldD/PmbA family protein [Candidatus Methanofastidiosia archaeon]|jgi:TldD protein